MKLTAAWRHKMQVAYCDTRYARRCDLDQCRASISTVLRRTELLSSLDADTLILGDDDLLSVGLDLWDFSREITVVDVDPAVLDLIRAHASSRVRTILHDMRNPLPSSLTQRFKVVFTDPPYNVFGQQVFIHRALTALQVNGGEVLNLCASVEYLGPSEIRKILSFVGSAGFRLFARFPRFNGYPAPPDVQNDVQRRYTTQPEWLTSDLFQFMRIYRTQCPILPQTAIQRMYEYP